MTPNDILLEFCLDEKLVWSIWYWNGRLLSTLKNKRFNWRLNLDIADIINEVEKMAKINVKNDQLGARKYESHLQWVNVSISDEDVQAIERWLSDEPNLLLEFVRLSLDGYACGVKPAPDGKGYMATITHNSQDSGTPGVGLSAFANDPYDAIGCLLYKFVVKCERALVPSSEQGVRKFR